MEAEKTRVKLRSLMFLFPVAQRDPSKVWSFLSAAFLELCRIVRGPKRPVKGVVLPECCFPGAPGL